VRRGVFACAVAAVLCALCLGLSSAALSDPAPQWGWWVGNSQGFFFSRAGDGLHEVDFHSYGMCGSEASADLEETLTPAVVTPDAGGNFGGSGTDAYGQEYSFSGHLGDTHATGSFRIVSAPEFCPDGSRGDTGVISFDATCFQYCPAPPPPPPAPPPPPPPPPPPGGATRSLQAPAGTWSVGYPETFKCGRKRCSSYFYDGPKQLRPAMTAMLPARLVLTPKCPKVTCKVAVDLRTKSGKRYQTASVTGVRTSMGTHVFLTRPLSSISCRGKKVKGKLVVGLTYVAGGGKPAALTVKLRLTVMNPNRDFRICSKAFGTAYGYADMGYRATTTKQLS